MTTKTARRATASETCNSTGVIHSRGQRPYIRKSDRHLRHPERWTHIRICPCGYASPITTAGIARNCMSLHKCEQETAYMQLEFPYDLPAPVVNAVEHYINVRRQQKPIDIDATAVLRFADGDYDLPLNRHERFAVFALLRSRGVYVKRCAEVLHISWTTQARYRRLLEGAA